MQFAPRIAHDTGNIQLQDLTAIQGEWYLIPGKVRVTVSDNLVTCGSDIHVLELDGDALLWDRCRSEGVSATVIAWRTSTGERLTWVRQLSKEDLQAEVNRQGNDLQELKSVIKGIGEMLRQQLETNQTQAAMLTEIQDHLFKREFQIHSPRPSPVVREVGQDTSINRPLWEFAQTPMIAIKAEKHKVPGTPPDEPRNTHDLTQQNIPTMPSQSHDGRAPDMIMKQMRLLSTLKFKELDDEVLIEDHIKRIEHQLLKVGLWNGRFIETYLDDDVCNKFVESLKNVPSCSSTAKNILNEHGGVWHLLRMELIKRLANKEKLRVIFDRRISALQFPGITKVEDYIDQGAAIYRLICKVYGNNETSRIRELVHRFIMGIPFDGIRRDIIARMTQEGTDHPDWELSVPFVAPFDLSKNNEQPSVSSIVKDVCLLYRRSYIPNDKKSTFLRSNQPTASLQDKVNKVSEKHQPTANQAGIADDPKKWVLTGIDWNTRDESLVKLQEIGLEKPSAKKLSDGRVFVFFDSDKRQEDIEKLVQPMGFKVRKFHGRRPEGRSPTRGSQGASPKN